MFGRATIRLGIGPHSSCEGLDMNTCKIGHFLNVTVTFLCLNSHKCQLELTIVNKPKVNHLNQPQPPLMLTASMLNVILRTVFNSHSLNEPGLTSFSSVFPSFTIYTHIQVEKFGTVLPPQNRGVDLYAGHSMSAYLS